MRHMRPKTRLLMAVLIIVGSAAYGMLVAADRALASAISSGYVAVLVTIFILTNVWKKPDE